MGIEGKGHMREQGGKVRRENARIQVLKAPLFVASFTQMPRPDGVPDDLGRKVKGRLPSPPHVLLPLSFIAPTFSLCVF